MKTILSALITLSLGPAMAAPALALDTIHTLQGKTYQQCKIVQRDADGVAFTHRKGTARVLFKDLPESTRVELGYNAQAAAALDKQRSHAREQNVKEQQELQKRRAELWQALVLAEVRRASQQPVILYSNQPSPFPGPVPAVGFAAPGWGTGFFGHNPHSKTNRPRGWDAVGIAPIAAGSGGVHASPSGGFLFSGLPQIHQSPTLGYYNPGALTRQAVPGLVPRSPTPVVPGVGIRGSASLPAR